MTKTNVRQPRWYGVVLWLSIFIVAGCSAGQVSEKTTDQSVAIAMESKQPHSKTSEEKPSMEDNAVQLEFKRGEVLIVGSSRTHEGSEPMLQKYFQDVGPVAGAHGFTLRGRLMVSDTEAGTFAPTNFVGLYTFPSVDASKRFESEPSVPELKARRPTIWSDLRISHYVLEKDISLSLATDKVYEVRYTWGKIPSNISEQIISAGGKPLEVFSNGKHEMIPATLTGPTTICIIEWPSVDIAKKNQNAQQFERVDSIYTSVAPPTN